MKILLYHIINTAYRSRITKRNDDEKQWKRYRLCGYILIIQYLTVMLLLFTPVPSLIILLYIENDCKNENLTMASPVLSTFTIIKYEHKKINENERE